MKTRPRKGQGKKATALKALKPTRDVAVKGGAQFVVSAHRLDPYKN